MAFLTPLSAVFVLTLLAGTTVTKQHSNSESGKLQGSQQQEVLWGRDARRSSSRSTTSHTTGGGDSGMCRAKYDNHTTAAVPPSVTSPGKDAPTSVYLNQSIAATSQTYTDLDKYTSTSQTNNDVNKDAAALEVKSNASSFAIANADTPKRSSTDSAQLESQIVTRTTIVNKSVQHGRTPGDVKNQNMVNNIRTQVRHRLNPTSKRIVLKESKKISDESKSTSKKLILPDDIENDSDKQTQTGIGNTERTVKSNAKSEPTLSPDLTANSIQPDSFAASNTRRDNSALPVFTTQELSCFCLFKNLLLTIAAGAIIINWLSNLYRQGQGHH